MRHVEAMKVLIVDGSKERRRDLTEALADLNNVVVQGAVPDVRSALAALTQTSPDVVVTGVTLPDGDGTYLVERIRGMARTPAVIVVAVRITDEQRIHYLSVGADSYVSDVPGVRAAVVALEATRFAIGSIPPQESQRLLGRMTAGVVHDYNNYLHAADNSLELLERQGGAGELLQSARAALGAMQRLNATLLSYVRGSVPTTTRVDLGAVVTDTLALARRMISEDIVLATEIAANTRPVIGVRAELEQVVLNLVINACDAMATGGQLEISLRQCTSQAVMLEVSDSGVGIVNNGTASTKPGRSGAGLGLAIVRSVVARQGGALRILPRATGGTTVAVMLASSASALA